MPTDVWWYTGDTELEGGEDLRWRDVKRRSYDEDEDIQIVVVPSTQGPGLVARSNREVLKELFEDHPDVFTIDGDAIAVRGTSEDTDLIEILSGLYDYALINEEHHSKLQTEAQEEAWDNWARHEFEQGLMAQHDDLDNWDTVVDDLTDDQSWELFRTGRERANEDWREESDDGSVVINIDRILDELDAHDVIEKLVCDAERAVQEQLCDLLQATCPVGVGPQLRALVRALYMDGIRPPGVPAPVTRGTVEAEMRKANLTERQVERVYDRLMADPALMNDYLELAGRWITLYWATAATSLDVHDAADFMADNWDEISAALPEPAEDAA
jgi:hypothetical protein